VGAGPVGIIVNPASGKDIRRLVAHASVFDNQEKRSIVRRAILGAVAAGAERVLYMADPHLIVEQAIEGLDVDATFEAVDSPRTGSALDTTRSVALMHEAGCSIVITLGGDGTNRAAARAWRDMPVVAISTGTNNVFPQMVEGSIAGAAAGLVSSGALALGEVARQAKTIHVEIEGEEDDLALIDAALLNEPFVGARAVWQPTTLRTVVLARAEPAAVGLSAIGGLLSPVRDRDDAGLVIVAGDEGEDLLVPIAPGLFETVRVTSVRRLNLGETIEVEGPGVVAVDGERERTLRRGQVARLSVQRDGPWVVDVKVAMALAACRGLFRLPTKEASDGD